MGDPVDLSVIIVTSNSQPYLQECLDSLFQDLGNVAAEVVVVDNVSTDGTPALVRELFPQVSLIQNDEPHGFAFNNNLALRQVTGRYIWLLNPDTKVLPGATKTMLDYLSSHSDVGLVGARLLNANGTIQTSCYRFPSLRTEIFRDLLVSKLFPYTPMLCGPRYPTEIGEEPIQVDSVMGASMFMRCAAVERVGLLDEGFYMFFEEVDWCRRIRDAGWQILYLPQAQVMHYGKGSTKTMMARMEVEYSRSYLRLFRKYHGWGKAVIARMFLAAGLSIRVALWSLVYVSNFRPRAYAKRKLEQWWPSLLWSIVPAAVERSLDMARGRHADRTAR